MQTRRLLKDNNCEAFTIMVTIRQGHDISEVASDLATRDIRDRGPGIYIIAMQMSTFIFS